MMKTGGRSPFPRIRFGLRAFLILIALSGPVVAAIYWQFLADEVRSSSRSIPTGDLEVPSAVLNVVWTQSRFGDRRENLHIIVRIMTPLSDVVSATENIDGSPPGSQPRTKGISIRGKLTFVDGKLWTPQSRPCFLIFDPSSRAFVEIPITGHTSDSLTPLEATRLPEWKAEVIPAMRKIYSKSVEARQNGATRESVGHNF